MTNYKLRIKAEVQDTGVGLGTQVVYSPPFDLLVDA